MPAVLLYHLTPAVRLISATISRKYGWNILTLLDFVRIELYMSNGTIIDPQ